MKMRRPRILVITPVHHVKGVVELLENIGDITYLDDPTMSEVMNCIVDYEAIFTNPNKSQIFIGRKIIDPATNLQVICTASTGTNHIDKIYAAEKSIPILALTEERHIISKISSTAELAFALTLASLRNVVQGYNSVIQGEWDYTKYIGRQMNYLTVGVIGYGRLGSMYAGYCRAFGSRVLIFDPYKTIEQENVEQVFDLAVLLSNSDIVALHVHVTDETCGMINAQRLSQMKKDVLLVNTSRGDLINEADLVNFLHENPLAKVATDVIADEVINRVTSPLLTLAAERNQVIITPHIGGMTKEAQEIAYNHAVTMLAHFFSHQRSR